MNGAVLMFTTADIADIAGEQTEPDAVRWMEREQIDPEALLLMFESIERQWHKSDKTPEAVIDLAGQAFRLGWESQKAAC